MNASLSNDSVLTDATSGDVNMSLDKSLWNVDADSSVSTLNNGGTIVFADTSGGQPTAEYNTTLTVTGDYTGVDGTLVTNLDSGNDTADQLVVQGNATGNTNVAIGKVAATQADQGYISVVTVDGDASGATFNQVGRASVGGYEFQMHNTQSSGQSVWYLSDQADSTPPPTGSGDGDGDGNGDGNGDGGGTGTDTGSGGQSTPPTGNCGTDLRAFCYKAFAVFLAAIYSIQLIVRRFFGPATLHKG